MPSAPTQTQTRIPQIDLLKGLACTAIVWHHLAFYGPMSDIARPLAPALFDWLYAYGRLAVQVFLVLGGYLAAAQLAPQGRARFSGALQTIARRLARLLPCYALALLLALLAAALVRPWLDHPSVPDAPTLAQLLANALLLQDLVGADALSAGIWYVAIDLQLFALSVLLFAGVRALPWARRREPTLAQALVLGATAASLWLFNRSAALDSWAAYFFGAYGLGMLAHWAAAASSARQRWLWLAAIALLAASALAIDWRSRIAVAGLTACGLALAPSPARASAWNSRGAWRAAAPLLHLGQMCYPVFLVHFAVSLPVSALVSSLWPTAALPNALGMLASFSLSLAAGRALHLRVERQPARWSAALRWQLLLLGAGLLVAQA